MVTGKSIILVCWTFLAAVLSSCHSTKYTYLTGQPKILSNSTVLIKGIGGLDEEESIDRLRTGGRLLGGVTDTVYYLFDEHYNLLSKGLRREWLSEDEFIEDLKSAVKRHLDIDYIIDVRIAEYRNVESNWDSYSETEANANSYSYLNDDQKAEVHLEFTIYNTGFANLEHKFIVATTTKNLEIGKEDGEETRINYLSAGAAMQIALKKGFKRIRKEVIIYSRPD